MTIEEVVSAALQLTAKERARLAEELLASLDSLSEDEVQELWAAEAIRRNADFDRNPDSARPGEDVLRALRDWLV